MADPGLPVPGYDVTPSSTGAPIGAASTCDVSADVAGGLTWCGSTAVERPPPAGETLAPRCGGFGKLGGWLTGIWRPLFADHALCRRIAWHLGVGGWRTECRMRGLRLLLLLLLFATVSGCERETSPAVPRAAAAAAARNPAMDGGCRAPFRTAVRFIILKRRGRYFRARSRYYANSDATRQSCRLQLLMSGDIHPNPGPRSEVPAAAADRRTRENQQLSCLVQNVRSLKNKLGTLRALSLVLQRHDILSWTETWLKDHVADSELQQALGTHVWFRRDRAASSGGGVACAVGASLRPVRRPELERGEALVVELIGLRSPTTHSGNSGLCGHQRFNVFCGHIFFCFSLDTQCNDNPLCGRAHLRMSCPHVGTSDNQKALQIKNRHLYSICGQELVQTRILWTSGRSLFLGGRSLFLSTK